MRPVVEQSGEVIIKSPVLLPMYDRKLSIGERRQIPFNGFSHAGALLYRHDGNSTFGLR